MMMRFMITLYIATSGFSGLRAYVAKHGSAGLPALAAPGIAVDQLSPEQIESLAGQI